MNDYEKYSKISENIGIFGLSNEAVAHFENMYQRLKNIIEKEAVGPLTSEEVSEKEAIMLDMDSFVGSFIRGKQSDLEGEIDKFRRLVVKAKNKFNAVKSSLVLGDGIDVDMSNYIAELDNDLKELMNEASELISKVDEFKRTVEGYTVVQFTDNYHDIQNYIIELKNTLKDIKQHQIDKYNVRVSAVNSQIEELKALDASELTPEILEAINSLEGMSTCDITINSFNSIKYMEKLDYKKLVEISAQIAKIKTAIGKYEEDKIVTELNEEISWVEQEIHSVEEKVQELENRGKDNLTETETENLLKEIEELSNKISNVSKRISDYVIKLNNFKDRLSEEKYNEYDDRVNDAQADLASLNSRLNIIKTPFMAIDYNRNFNEKLNVLEGEVNSFAATVESLVGKVWLSSQEKFEQMITTFEARLNDIETVIEKSFGENKIDQNQYESLMKRVGMIRNTLTTVKEKVRNPEMYNNADIFSILNGTIDGIEKSLETLENEVESLSKPIKDKDTRKRIDRSLVAIEKEIKDVEETLEKYKEEDPDKYQEASDRLTGLKDRLGKLGKNYRSKCPFLVRTVKSAKNFFKNHKKMCLVIAGLAAIALIHATVGPILIPAIMHGNIMLAATVPALRGFVTFVNNILGGMIGATLNPLGQWILANGAIINPAVASTSLLKGLAISGLGSAVLLTPMIAAIVMAVKKLMKKMKNSEFKFNFGEKFQNGKENLREKFQNGRNKITNKFKKKKKNKSDKEFLSEIRTLLNDFKESGLSFDEYCAENELSDSQKIILQSFLEKSNEEKEEKGRGRN